MTGKAILTPQFDGTARDTLTLVVEIAWGADITAADTTWTWTDVTADVYLDPGVSITMGRADEASKPQPANCKFTVDNTDGSYSQTPLGSNWPNVKRGTPVRVRAILGTTSHTRFEGFAVGFTPGFDETGTVAVSDVEAAGVYRRLNQGATALQSVMRSSIPTLSDLSAYWPLEDGKTATSLASGLSTGLPMNIASGTPELASNSDFAASSPIPVLKGSYLLGFVNPRVTSSVVKFTFLASFPEAADAAADGSFIARLHTTGSIVRWDLIYGTGGILELTGTDASGTQQFTNGGPDFNVDGQVVRVSIELTQNGSDVDTRVSTLAVGVGNSAGFFDDTATGQTMTGCYAVAFSPDASQTNLAVGHAYLQTTSATDIFDLSSQLNAFDTETTGNRFTRLCGQVGVTHSVSNANTQMGPQKVDTFPNLLQECADAELGVIVDGLSAGLKFFGRSTRENETAALTLDASDDTIIPPFDPVDDDQGLVNQWTVQQKDGSSAVSADLDGPLGVNVVGLYDDSVTLNIHDSARLQPIADWLVHEFTVQGYRYPSFALEFNQSPDFLDDWLGASLLSRVDITNIAKVATQLPDQDIRLLIEGYNEQITQFVWSAQMNTSPYDPWRIAELAEDTGDTGEFLCILDTDGSTVKTAVSKGATSVTTTQPDGNAPWTTTADDFPLDLNIGGIRVHATAAGSATFVDGHTENTFTVDSSTVTKDLPAGTDVSVWEPTVLSL